MNRRHAAVLLPVRDSASVAIAGTTARVEIGRSTSLRPTSRAMPARPPQVAQPWRSHRACPFARNAQRVALAMTRQLADASPQCRDEPRRARKGMASAQSAVLPPCLFPA